MLKIAICDDEKSYLELISFKIQRAIQDQIGMDFEMECYSSIDDLYEQNQNRRFNRRFAPPLKGVNTGFAPERGF